VSKISDISRLEFILEMIEDIEYTIKENGSLQNAINNRIGKHALLMYKDFSRLIEQEGLRGVRI
ncbi:hypothetical protein, partial [Caminibacter sp.]